MRHLGGGMIFPDEWAQDPPDDEGCPECGGKPLVPAGACPVCGDLTLADGTLVPYWEQLEVLSRAALTPAPDTAEDEEQGRG